MSKNEEIAGTNWDANLFGKENNPLKLILEIVNELKLKNKTLTLIKFSDLTALETQISKIVTGNFTLSSHMTVEDLITAVINEHDQQIHYAVYGDDKEGIIIPKMNVFIDEPIQVNDQDEEIYPTVVLQKNFPLSAHPKTCRM